MARGAGRGAESVSDLYLRLGLDYDELEGGFVRAERTLRDNMARLSRENTVIDLQAQIEIAGLDETTDAERIFEIRSRQLNRTLEIQRNRLRLLSAQLEDTTRQTGSDSDATQRARIQYENARLSVARLENQLQELNNSQDSGTGWADEIAAFSQKAAPVLFVVDHLIDVFGKLNDAVNKLIDDFKELNKQGANFNLPIRQIDDFARKVRLAGGELDDIQGFIAGLTDALIKGETDDPEYIALKRYGETIFEASGQLKSYVEIWEAVQRAFKKAKAEGKEVEFLQMVGGESGIKDAMLALNNWEKAVKNASKIVKAELDYSSLEKATDVSSQLSEQMDELGKSISSIFQPYITAAAETFFEVLRKGTSILNNLNAEFKEINKQTAELPSPLLHPLDFMEQNFAIQREQAKKIAAMSSESGRTLKKLFENSAGLDQAYADMHKRIKEKEKKEKNVFQQYADQRTKELKDAIADLKIEIEYENEYQKAIAEANLERERALRQIVVGDEERRAIEEKYRTDIEKAEKDHNDKMEDMARETAAIQYEMSHSAFEKEIYDIEQWKKKALEDLGEYKDAIGDKSRWVKESATITAQAAAKEAQAVEKEIDRIKDKNKSLVEKIFDLTHGENAIKAKNIQKEAAEYREAGADPMLIEMFKAASMQKEGLTGFDTDYWQAIEDFNDAITEIQTDELSQKVDNLKELSVSNLETSFDSASSAADNLTTAFNRAAQTLDNPRVDIKPDIKADIKPDAKADIKPDAKSDTPDISGDTGLIAEIQKLVQTEQSVFPQVEALSTSLDKISQSLESLSQTAGSIVQDAQSVKNSQPPVINVNPNINIDLGGAYVFDDAMKSQLTTDITIDVINAVTSGVMQGTNELNVKNNYSYG